MKKIRRRKLRKTFSVEAYEDAKRTLVPNAKAEAEIMDKVTTAVLKRKALNKVNP